MGFPAAGLHTSPERERRDSPPPGFIQALSVSDGIPRQAPVLSQT
jgi:hypothetical protein